MSKGYDVFVHSCETGCGEMADINTLVIQNVRRESEIG